MYSRIEALCRESNITIAELERNLGFGVSTIRRWSNSSPSIDKIIKVADYFDVSIDYLTGYASNENNLVVENIRLKSENKELRNKLQIIFDHVAKIQEGINMI